MREKKDRIDSYVIDITNAMTDPKNWKWCLLFTKQIGDGTLEDGIEPDHKTEVFLLNAIAEQGSCEAVERLSDIYFANSSAVEDIESCCKWLPEAASNGFVKAMEFLATIQLLDERYRKDHDNYEAGIELCKQLLAKRPESAFYVLARCYDEGIGVEQNRSYSFYLYQLAVSEGTKSIINHAERHLRLYASEHPHPLKHIDFFPKAKYNGFVFGDPNDLKTIISSNIDFELSDDDFSHIEASFDYQWNSRLNELFEFDDLFEDIDDDVVKAGTNLSAEQRKQIYEIIEDFVDSASAYISEDKDAIFWDCYADMIAYPVSPQLVTLLAQDINNNTFNYLNECMPDILGTGNALIWSRRKSSHTLASEISHKIFRESDYTKHFTLEPHKNGSHVLSCIDKSMDLKQLYIIDNAELPIFEFCDFTQLCARDKDINLVIVDDCLNIKFPGLLELMSDKKKNKMTLVLLKALVLSLDIPVLAQIPSEFNCKTKEEIKDAICKVPFPKDCIEKYSDRVAAYCLVNKKPKIYVLKDNECATGKVEINNLP